MDVKDKRILVVGFGLSGEAAARLLIREGAKVLVIDESQNKNMKRRARRKKNYGIQFRFGMKSTPMGRFDAAILSPGVHPHRGLGKAVHGFDIPVYGELELGAWFCQCPIIGITGTNGKTTTTELVARVIEANKKRTLAAGNIGLPLCEAALRSEELDYLAVEVSSFQLETIEKFRPLVSVMMNITPDHLDRYRSMEEYATTKAVLWKNQTDSDIAIVNLDTEGLLGELGFTPPKRTIRYSIRGRTADLWFDGRSIRGSILEQEGLRFVFNETKLRGIHNAENVMAALAVAHALDLDLIRAWKGICEYEPLAHRLETVGIVAGIEFVNDSKATNIDAMEKALSSFSRPVILIAGGKDKGFNFRMTAPLIREKVKACILIGEMREQIFQAWKNSTSCVFADSLEEAVGMAAKLGQKDDVVLLSPGCSSYDMFENYEERGEVFRRAVNHLLTNKPQTSKE